MSSHRKRHSAIARVPPNLVRVPLVAQKRGFSCGDAATLALLRYWRWETYAGVDERALYGPLKTTATKGTDAEPIAEFFRRAGGFEARYRRGDVGVADLESAIDAREPPIVALQAWRDDRRAYRDSWDAGHYVVMVGYDDANLFVMDPSTSDRYAFLSRADLQERWHDVEGACDERFDHMAIFVRAPGERPAFEREPPAFATRLP